MGNKNFFQSQQWQNFQKTLSGRKTGYIEKDGEKLYWTTIPTVFRHNYLYVNRGPVRSLKPFWPQLLDIANRHRCLYIKVEPPWEKNEPYKEELLKLGFKKTSLATQPDTTLLLDLTQSEHELLKQMKPKGRYNIKIAKKHSVTYQVFTEKEKGSDKALQDFYKMLEETAKRDHFGIHDFEYYQNFLKVLSPQNRLFLAYKDNTVVAGILAVFFDDTVTYYYGASANKSRETMATYGLQWHVITTAKSEGYHVYDFLGIAPENAGKNHPWQGVTDFKKKLGGSVYSYAGTYHFILKPFLYFLLNVFKTLLQAKKTFSR